MSHEKPLTASRYDTLPHRSLLIKREDELEYGGNLHFFIRSAMAQQESTFFIQSKKYDGNSQFSSEVPTYDRKSQSSSEIQSTTGKHIFHPKYKVRREFTIFIRSTKYDGKAHFSSEVQTTTGNHSLAENTKA